MFVREGLRSEESRSMEDYNARFNPQSISQEAMRGSTRLVGTTLVLPYNHVPHSSLGSEHEEDMDETMYAYHLLSPITFRDRSLAKIVGTRHAMRNTTHTTPKTHKKPAQNVTCFLYQHVKQKS